MPELLSTGIGALALMLVSLVSWYSPRATYEGRLLLRVERLGAAYAVMPSSSEKESFERHLTGEIKKLNEWIDPNNARKRRIVRNVKVWLSLLALAGLLFVLPGLAPDLPPAVSAFVGFGVGTVIAIVAIVVEQTMEKLTRRRDESALAERNAAETEARISALRLGEAPPSQTSP